MKYILPFILLFSSLPANPLEKIFTKIYRTNGWHSDPETASGPGSTLAKTVNIRKALPEIFLEYNIQTVLDLPCGDFNWMKEIDLSRISYHGGDIVRDIIHQNNKKYAKKNISFSFMDATAPIPKSYDLIICRDLLHHLTIENISKVLKNIKESGSKYLLATCHRDEDTLVDIQNGAGRLLNIELPPFNMGPPLFYIVDDYGGRHIGLWQINK